MKLFALELADAVLKNPVLCNELKEKQAKDDPLPYAARSGDTSNLEEAVELYDKAETKAD